MLSKGKNFLWMRVALYLFMGVLIFLNPTIVLKWALYLIAGIIVLIGVVDIIAYFRVERGMGFLRFDFVSGIILILLGVMLAVKHSQVVDLVHIFIGIMIALDGANTFVQSRRLGWRKPNSAGGMAIYSLVVIAVGALIVFNPFAAQVVAFRFFAIVLMAMGISDLLWYFRFRNA